MNKQYAVFGIGRFGESVAMELQSLGCEVIAIDKDMDRVEHIADSISYAMQADFSDADFLRSLGTRNLDGVVIAESVDLESSIMATVICKEIGVPYVVVKARNERHAEILKKIDRVGRRMWMGQGMCGSLSGSIPTNVGQPRIRVSEITVGGKGGAIE